MHKKNRRYLKARHRKQKKPLIAWRLAGREEGIRRLLSHRAYYEGFSQNDLNYRLQKKDAFLKEWLSYAKNQVADFSGEEARLVDWSMRVIIRICRICSYKLPPTKPITFVKTSLKEECEAAAYTHGTEIYLGQELLHTGLEPDDDCKEHFLWTVAHELFHCFTRQNPGFRRDMYALIRFHIEENEFVFSPEITSAIIRNPDVERHDSWAYFRIQGQPTACAAIFTTERPFEKAGDSFMTSMKAALVPIEDPSRLYDPEEAEDFWDILGQNTEYVVDPEEVLADNFAYALIMGPQGYQYPSPWLIEGILKLLSVSQRSLSGSCGSCPSHHN